MGEGLISKVCVWNYTRGNVGYDNELEYNMLLEELDEYAEAIVNKDVVEEADALADIIFVAIGSLYKITNNANAVKEILDIVCDANEQKGHKKDKDGKIIKDRTTFISPEINIHRVLENL